MYVLVRGVEGTRRDVAGVVLSVLERCVAMTGLSCAFVAVERTVRGRSTIAIRARYSTDPQQGRCRLSSGMRLALHSAIESASPVIVTSQRRSRAAGFRRVLIAAPLMSNERCIGALAATGHIPPPYVKALRSIRQLASMLDVGKLIGDSSAPLSESFIRAVSARQDMLLHELRVPLSAASLLLESLTNQRARENHATGHEDVLRDAYRAVQDAQSIVRHFSQLQSLSQGSHPITLRPTQVQAIIERAIALLPGSMGRLRHTTPDHLPDVAADPLWLTHILTNLLENAVTHAPAPHAVSVASAFSPDNKRVEISITSYGAGITPAEQAAILRPYRRPALRNDLTSKGLGLSIAKYLVTQMRGDLWVQSDGLHSATFRISLPVASPSDH